MATVVLDNVNKVYDNGFHAIHDLSLRSRTASSSCSSDPRAAASRRRCEDSVVLGPTNAFLFVPPGAFDSQPIIVGHCPSPGLGSNTLPGCVAS